MAVQCKLVSARPRVKETEISAVLRVLYMGWEVLSFTLRTYIRIMRELTTVFYRLSIHWLTRQRLIIYLILYFASTYQLSRPRRSKHLRVYAMCMSTL